MIATALPTGIHVAFISVPSLVQLRVLIGRRPDATNPQPPASGVPRGNLAEMLRLLMPPLGVRAGIVPEVAEERPKG